LERARRNRGKALLEQSREAVKEINKRKRESAAEQKRLKAEAAATTANAEPSRNGKDAFLSTVSDAGMESFAADENKEKSEGVSPPRQPLQSVTTAEEPSARENGNGQREQNQNDLYNQRKPISEVLNDLYGEK
ncbi:MAG TPA: hypothetical protein VK400_01675, partial [Pyrinomonadaceae bacterium]|nr:hypothetical protein [Pyrinomonadaceae bacterium]